MSDLTLATSDELIRELMKRKTFKGVVLWQISGFKGRHVPEWRWESANMSPLEVVGVFTETTPQIINAATGAIESKCTRCEVRLVFSARQSGTGLCGPCMRRESGEQSKEREIDKQRECVHGFVFCPRGCPSKEAP